MRTPKEYAKNLEAGIITEEMLSDALYSVNKRAKNWRDKKREYKKIMRQNRYHTDKYHNIDKAEENEAKMYEKKEKLLSIVEPVCIHQELAGFDKERILDSQKNFSEKYTEAAFAGEICWINSFIKKSNDYEYYYGYYSGEETWFFDRQLFDHPMYRYYMYYSVGQHTFHTPIEESDLEKYKNIRKVPISTIETYGKETVELISVQFVDKVIALIDTGQYKLQYSKDIEHHTEESEQLNLADMILRQKESNRAAYMPGAIQNMFDDILTDISTTQMPTISELNHSDTTSLEKSFQTNLLAKKPSKRYQDICNEHKNDKKEYAELKKLYNRLKDVRPNMQAPQKPDCPIERIYDMVSAKNPAKYDEIKDYVMLAAKGDISKYRIEAMYARKKEEYFREHQEEWIRRCFPEYDTLKERIEQLGAERKQSKKTKKRKNT